MKRDQRGRNRLTVDGVDSALATGLLAHEAGLLSCPGRLPRLRLSPDRRSHPEGEK